MEIMYSPRKIESSPNWRNTDGVKIYTISPKNSSVEQSKYHDRLKGLKKIIVFHGILLHHLQFFMKA